MSGKLTKEEAESKYGAIENGVWAYEAKWCALLPVSNLPGWINTATGAPVVHIYCNKEMAPPLASALKAVVDQGLQSQLKTFDGCYSVRDIRALPGQPSAHSYACAIDINAATNKLGESGDMSPELAKCFTDQGFVWGKTFHRLDPMHLSWLGW